MVEPNLNYMTDEEAAAAILDIGRRMYAAKMAAANDGNISVKVSQNAVWCTPTGVSKGFMKEDMLVKLDLEGNVLRGQMEPSSEIKMHLRVYNENPDVQGVVHGHPPIATSYAIARIPLDAAILPEAIVNLGVVPVAPYGNPGSEEVPDSIAPFVKDYNAVLLSNHGALTWGRTIYEAYYRLETLEHYAGILMYTTNIIGKKNTLSFDQIQELLKTREKLGITSGGIPLHTEEKAEAGKNENIMNCDTVALDDEKSALVILNQTKLPCEVELLSLTSQKDIWNAIYLLQVRGAPAIGVAAAIGLYLAAKEIPDSGFGSFYAKLKAAKDYLASSRPTAVNLFWALNRMEKVAIENSGKPVAEIKRLLYQEAVKIKDEDIRVCRQIGEYGLSLLEDGFGILTHCNAGQLAASKYGTALAPVHLGHEKGRKFKVYCDETRPLLQGARLTAFELYSNGIDTTVICDNMASQVMKNGWVQAVLVGCDRVAANGDACNKIGTSGVAILAKHYGIPFYVCAPTSTIDMSIKKGEDIPIEERPSHEITEMWYKKRMAPEGVNVYNPAFDFVDNDLITAIITEYGIARAPYAESLAEIFRRKNEHRL